MTLKRRMLDLARQAREKRLADAAAHAQWVIESCCIKKWPVRPLQIAATETPLLKVRCGNYRNKFDGRLEYHRRHGPFLLFYNTKYDENLPPGRRAPRTRFSIAHELGHFFLAEHHEYLRRGGEAHQSRSEFVSNIMMEKEADTFAANLLLPSSLFRPLVNEEELSLTRIEKLADEFETSRVSTAIQAVKFSDFHCAVAGIRKGAVAWSFVSEPLIKGGFYPGPRGVLSSAYARDRWRAFQQGDTDRAENPAWAREWFRTYKEGLGQKPVTEQYLPVQVMDTLVVFLNIPEDEVYDAY